jgi:hypothetical protein
MLLEWIVTLPAPFLSSVQFQTVRDAQQFKTQLWAWNMQVSTLLPYVARASPPIRKRIASLGAHPLYLILVIGQNLLPRPVSSAKTFTSSAASDHPFPIPRSLRSRAQSDNIEQTPIQFGEWDKSWEVSNNPSTPKTPFKLLVMGRLEALDKGRPKDQDAAEGPEGSAGA